MTRERWLEVMQHDKKTTDGRLRFVLLEAIGHAVVRSDVSNDVVVAVLPI
jgi:3-dehydroquinate synthetase